MSDITLNPTNNAVNVERNPIIEIPFTCDLDVNSINEKNILLVEKDTNVIVNGRITYVSEFKYITIRLYDYLKANTDYCIVIIPGVRGVYKDNPYEPYTLEMINYNFKTGTLIDPDNPLLLGETTQITTPTNITEEPTEDSLCLTSTSPVYNSTDNIVSEMSFTFNKNISSYTGLQITAEDALGWELNNESIVDNYDVTINNNILTIKPKSILHESLKLRYSTIYTITIDKVVSDNLELNNVENTFITKFKPQFTTVRLVRKALSDIIKDVTDLEIKEFIYEYSVYVYLNSYATFDINNPSQTVKDFVFCATKLALINNLYNNLSSTGASGSVVRKTLSDFTIQYGSDATALLTRTIKALEDCVKKSGQLLRLPMYDDTCEIKTTVKSYDDPRRPATERIGSWTRLSYIYPNFRGNHEKFRIYGSRAQVVNGNNRADRSLGYDTTL